MGPRNLPQEQPQQLFQDAAQDVQAQKAQAELEATVLRFWDTVRKSADVIVTLRQENAVLQAQVAALRSNETQRMAHVDVVPEIPAIDVEATEALILKAHEAEVRGLRTNIDRLEDELNRLQNELNEAQAQLGDHAAISQQLSQVRMELEVRSKLLLELQVTLEEQRNQRQLDRRQLDIFGSAPERGMAPAEMLALATRLDALSGRISSLFGIS